MSKTLCNIVWFKRDLRLTDHQPLVEAIAAKLPVMLCYFWEPSQMNTSIADPRHWQFVQQSLADMQARLAEKGLQLYIFHSEVLPILDQLRTYFTIHSIFSHLEVGIASTFKRDLAVKKFCRNHGIQYKESPNDGIVRGLTHRQNWESQLDNFFKSPLTNPNLEVLLPFHLPPTLTNQQNFLPVFSTSQNSTFQQGGERVGWQYFTSFIHKRARHYINHISQPEASRSSTSRISPYLAYGNVSARQLFQYAALQKPQVEYERMLSHFQTRLWWRSHYIQKLESEWQIEFEPINKGFLLLDRQLDERFEAWASAKTGIPMVDASMRCLAANGFLNFRMRAMLVTFATFSLWQDWKAVADHLARLFLDFEPGIHYAQIQMQAGLTGYHTMRIFNPIVQGQRYDKEGIFIKKWLPELRLVPTPLLFEPWKMTSLEQRLYGCVLGIDYPKPIVNYEVTTRLAKEKYWQIRQHSDVQAQLPSVWRRHCIPKSIKDYEKQAQAIVASLAAN
jgi:deoxyribodipyrimidine photo-lyase